MPGLQHVDGHVKVDLGLGELAGEGEGHSELVASLGNGPGVGRQGLLPHPQADCQVVHRQLVLLILQTDLPEAEEHVGNLLVGVFLPLSAGVVGDVDVEYLGQLQHLPGQLQVARLLVSLSSGLLTSLHLVFNHHLLATTHLLRLLTNLLLHIFVLVIIIVFSVWVVDHRDLVVLLVVVLKSCMDTLLHL